MSEHSDPDRRRARAAGACRAARAEQGGKPRRPAEGRARGVRRDAAMAPPACATSCAAPTWRQAPSTTTSRTRTRSSRRWCGELTGELLKRHREGRAKARTAEEFVRAHYAAYFNFIAEDPETAGAGAQELLGRSARCSTSPTFARSAQALNEDIRAAIAQRHPAQRRSILFRRVDRGRGLRTLDGDGRARPGGPRRGHRIRDAPCHGRPRQTAEAPKS